MKRVFTSCFLLVFLLNLVGWQWILIQKQNLRRESRWSALQTESPQSPETITIKVSDRSSREVCFINRHEIVYRGRLYDVERISKSGNETVYSCSADHDEEEIMASFDSVVKSNVSPGTSVHSKNIKLIKTVIDNYSIVSTAHFIAGNNSLFISFFSILEIGEPFIDPASMPPEADALSRV